MSLFILSSNNTIGYEVVAVEGLTKSMNTILNFNPDLIMLDVEMPGFSGDKLVRILNKSSTNTPIIYHSSLPAETLRELAYTTKTHGYICKSDNILAYKSKLDYYIKIHNM